MSQIIGLLIIIFLVISLLMAIINTYNKIIRLKFNIEKSFANLSVILKQRTDEIPNLVNILQHYVQHEKNLLKSLTELRTRFLNANTIEDKTITSNEISKALKSVLAISENYPTLLSNNNYIELQKRISELEDKIADRREFFNDSVNLYNIGIHEFPNIILARLLNYKTQHLLQITKEEEKYDGIQF